MRAVAVVLVVATHTLGWPFGGFVGVDVFYVISGFLITGLLLGELERTGSVSLRAFYSRRVRRIVPAALVVLVVTSVMAFALWFTPRALQAFTDAVSAAVFVSNWHFIALRVDYLQADAAVSPSSTTGRCRSRSSSMRPGRCCSCCCSQWHAGHASGWAP